MLSGDSMSTNNEVRENLRQIVKLARISLSRLDGSSSRTASNVTPARREKRKSLNIHILELRSDGFFKQPKTPKETHKKLSVTYSCKLNRVEVELGRLQKRKQLRKTSKLVGGNESVAYVW